MGKIKVMIEDQIKKKRMWQSNSFT